MRNIFWALPNFSQATEVAHLHKKNLPLWIMNKVSTFWKCPTVFQSAVQRSKGEKLKVGLKIRISFQLLPYSFANGHIMLNTPVLVRSLKLSSIELSQYLDGWPPGNTGCCWHFKLFNLIKFANFGFLKYGKIPYYRNLVRKDTVLLKFSTKRFRAIKISKSGKIWNLK